MRIRSSHLAALSAAACLALALLPGSADARPTTDRPTLSGHPQISAEAKRMDAKFVPLRRVANAIDAVGRSTAAAVYSGLTLDGVHGTVNVWLTDAAQEGAVVAQARALDAKAQFNRVRWHHGTFTRAALNAVRDQLLSADESHALPYRVFNGYVSDDGSGIHVGVSDTRVANGFEAVRKAGLHRALLSTPKKGTTAAPAVNVSFYRSTGKGVVPAYSKWNDTSHQIGGDQLTPPGGGWCTAGFAADDSAGNNYLITAGHCGAGIYRSGWGTTVVGTTTMGPDNRTDSVAIKGGPFNNDEGEANPNSWYAELSGGHAYSYVNDVVCQNGVSTAWRQAETACDITVRNDDAWWYTNEGQHVQGVIGTRGYDKNHPAVIQGDSGATVFTWNGGNRQLRGIVEGVNPCADQLAGCQSYGSGTDWLATMPNGQQLWASDTVGWVEATDILNHYGLTQDTKP